MNERLFKKIAYFESIAENQMNPVIKDMLVKNINSTISQKNPEVLKQFIKLNKLDIDIDSFKIGKKINVPTSAIKIPDSMQMTGFKAFEKTVLQSIFETQKNNINN